MDGRLLFGALLASSIVIAIGCDGVILDPRGEGGGGSGGGSGGGTDPATEPLRCETGDLKPAEAPLRRLTPVEYENSVRDLFPGVTLPDIELVESSDVGGFDNNADGQVVSPLLIEQYQTAAASIGAAVSADRGWLPCDPAGDEVACGREVATTIAEGAYRRPLTAEEQSRIESFFDSSRATFGFDDAVAMVVEGILQSPTFLYRPEVGTGAEAPEGLIALGPWEIASRLSYLLWQTAPDEELRAAAEAGELSTPAELEAQARRMLDDPRARDTIVDFHRQWLELERLEEVQLSTELYPELDPAMRDALIESTERYLAEGFFGGSSFEEMMTSNHAWANDDIAELLGVPAPGSDELVRVETNPEERAGILTQPGVLASTSHGLTHSPILRGVLLLDAFLCMRPPPPPPGVDVGIEEDDPDAASATTTREKIERTHGTTECAACHDAIDGAGFAFETYDALGRYRTTELGHPVDPTGELTGTRDIDGEVEDGVAMAHRIASSGQAQECFATRWYRYAMGRTEKSADRCQIQALAEAMNEAGDVRELLVTLVTSPSFRFRPEPAGDTTP